MRVDVLLPVFNSERTIRSAVASVLQQTFRDFRVIAIDDGSTDRSAEILGELARIDSRLLVIRTKNCGIVDALNAGLQHCDAEIIARQDADDLSFPNRFERQIRYLEQHSDCVAVSANALHIDSEGDRIGGTYWGGDAHGDTDTVPARDPHLLHPFLMVRHAALRQIGGYRHVLRAEDVDLYWRLEPLGRLHVLKEQLGAYRIHQASLTSGSVQSVRAAALFSQLAALSAKRRSERKEDIPFSRDFEDKVMAATDLAGMVDRASEILEPHERAYLEVRTAAKMSEQRIFRKFRFQRSDVWTIATYLWRHRGQIGRTDRLVLMQVPFWYYYKPRAYLAALRRIMAFQPRRLK